MWRSAAGLSHKRPLALRPRLATGLLLATTGVIGATPESLSIWTFVRPTGLVAPSNRAMPVRAGRLSPHRNRLEIAVDASAAADTRTTAAREGSHPRQRGPDRIFPLDSAGRIRRRQPLPDDCLRAIRGARPPGSHTSSRWLLSYDPYRDQTQARPRSRASPDGAGPLTPALPLRQERGHRARADPRFRSGRIPLVSYHAPDYCIRWALRQSTLPSPVTGRRNQSTADAPRVRGSRSTQALWR
jgi:hypothetical protein